MAAAADQTVIITGSLSIVLNVKIAAILMTQTDTALLAASSAISAANSVISLDAVASIKALRSIKTSRLTKGPIIIKATNN